MKRHKSPTIDPVDLNNSKILTVSAIHMLQYIKKIIASLRCRKAQAMSGQANLCYFWAQGTEFPHQEDLFLY